MPLTTQVITARVLDKAVITGKCCTQGGELFAESRALGDTERVSDKLQFVDDIGLWDDKLRFVGHHLTERLSRVRIVTGETA